MSTTTLGPVPLRGRLDAIGSKSDAHRALICAMLCGEPTEIVGLPDGLDVCATARCLEALGCELREDGDVTCVTPGELDCSPTLNCGESGTTLRLLLPVTAGLEGCDPTFTGRGRLPERPLEPLLRALSAHGVRFDAEGLPLGMEGRATGGEYNLPGDLSSQFISGTLLMLGTLGGRVELTSPLESAGYVEMTRQVMGRFGVRTDGLSVEPQAYRSPGRYILEGDWSSAAVWLAAGALGEGVTVDGLRMNSYQPDRAIVELLREMGAEVTVEPGADGSSSVTARQGVLRGIRADCSQHPDIAPVLMALGAVAEGETELYGLERLRLKESDRLSAIVAALRALGADVFTDGGTVRIQGLPSLAGGTVECVGDHRIAMAASILAPKCAEPVVLRDSSCVEKSYSRFFEDYAALGGDVEE